MATPYTLDQLKSDTGANNWTGQQIYDKAKESGFTADQLDQTGGWAPGTAAKWAADNGLDPLTGPAEPAKPLDFNGQMAAFTQSLNSMFPGLGQVSTGSISASDRAADLIKEGSPLLDLAQSNAMAQANSRGLLNSSMAAGAGTRAMLDEAGRFATADANNELSLQQTQLANQARLRDQVGQFGMTMQRDEAQWDRQDGQRAEERQWQLADRDAGWARADELDEITFSRNLQAAYTSAVDGITTQLTADINRVQAADLPADVKAEQIAALQATARTQVEFRNTLFESMDGWKSEWAQFILELPTT